MTIAPNTATFVDQFIKIIRESGSYLSNIKPSDWVEQNVIMGQPFPGPYRYARTPYCREIIDRLSPNDPARWIAIMKGAQIGLALDIDTDIPTPSGFRKMADLKKGDFVFSEKGLPVRVTKATEVMYGHVCYKVTFTDGTVINADADHLWSVHDLKNIPRVLTTEQISRRVRRTDNSRNRYYVKNARPLEMPDKELPIDPYLLGLWLGDGSKSSNTITAVKADAEIYKKELLKKGIEVNLCPYKYQENTYSVRVQKAFNFWNGGKNLYNNKHIPDEYFTASYNQRLELLQGLIDSDGHIMKDGKVEFYNIDLNLIEQVRTLVASLGYKVTMRKRNNEGKKMSVYPGREYSMQDLYVLNFMGFKEVPVAKLPRKVDRLQPNLALRQEINKRWICGVEKIESRPVKCITVDSATHLYLASRSYIPTHNSSGVIIPGMGWIIKENPGNTYFTVGAPDLIDKSFEKLDIMIDNAGLRRYIMPQIQRNRANKSGDTNTKKDFMGGYINITTPNNHKEWRDVSLKYGFIDDFESAKTASKESGSTRKLMEMRFAAYEQVHKIFYISTPENKATSNIEPAYLLGDQRKYMVPCPECGERIEWLWTVVKGEITGGIIWDEDPETGKLVKGSVRYRCQECGGEFDDKEKHRLLNDGKWEPTAEPSKPGYFSYHISSLYAPLGMYGWEHYANDWIEANPKGQPRKEDLYKTFVTTVLGLTYEEQAQKTDSKNIQRNVRPYEIHEIPEALSMKEGNGRITLITCAADMNGREDDARLDWEVSAWAENGQRYSIAHGSIGTFIPNQNKNSIQPDRLHWTYEQGKPNCVWPEYDKILNRIYDINNPDGTLNRRMMISIGGLDSGYLTKGHAYVYVDGAESRGLRTKVRALKGDKESALIKLNVNVAKVKPTIERPLNTYMVQVGLYKDELAHNMRLKWSPGDAVQPSGFMNFPEPAKGLYGLSNYFEHFEAEQRVIVADKSGTDVAYKWNKITTSAQNHMWDCAIYNAAVRDIWLLELSKDMGVKALSWEEYSQWYIAKVIK